MSVKKSHFNWSRIASPGAFGILLLAASSSSSSASIIQTLSYSVDTGLSDPTGSSTPFALPKFSLGHILDNVTVTLDGEVDGSIKVANRGTLDPAVTKPATAATFVTGPAAGASCTGAGAAKKCDKWSIKFNAAPHAVVNESVTSMLGAKVQIKVGPSTTLIVTLPASAPVTENLQFGPDYNPDTYSFLRTYHITSGAKQTAAQVFAEVTNPTSHGSVTGANAHVWKVDILDSIHYPGNFQPDGAFTKSPCDMNFNNAGCVVGADTYLAGKTHTSLSGFASANHLFTTPAELAFFTGHGNFSFSEQAFGNSTFTGGGNDIFNPQVQAKGIVTVLYTYTVPEPASIALLGSALCLAGFTARGRKKKIRPILG